MIQLTAAINTLVRVCVAAYQHTAFSETAFRFALKQFPVMGSDSFGSMDDVSITLIKGFHEPTKT